MGKLARTASAAAMWALVACRGGVPASDPQPEPSPEQERTPKTAAAGPNVLLVTIDTLRADHLPVYGYGRVQTPFLSSLARRGVVFEQCAAHAPITLPSHTSILTGLYPPEHGVRSNGGAHADDELHTLAELYAAHGYGTAAFVSAFVLDSRFGLAQGFSHYDDDLEDGRQRWSVFGVKDRRAGDTVERFVGWLDARKADAAPFFVWLHLYDPHYEYEPPEPFRSMTAHPYDGEIAYTDHELGRLWQALEARDLDDDTLLAVTSDHGESLGEHGESTHSLFVYEATQHVPLILRLPRDAHGGTRVAGLARHVDLAPTLVEMSGLAEAEAEWLGQRSGASLRTAIEGGTLEARTSYAEAYLPRDQFGWSALFAVRDAARKYIEAPRPELYDLADDPDERHNLLEAGHAAPPPLTQALAALRERPRWQDAAESRALDAESKAKLRALGYVADEAPDPAQAGADPKDMTALYEARERVHHLMDAGDVREAIPRLRKLLEQDPENAGLVGDLASCLAELGKWPAAEEAYRTLARLRPDSAAAHAGLAKVAFKGRRDFERAHEELAAARALSPHDPSLHGLEGDLLHEQGKLEQAVDAYARAVEAGDQTPSYFVGHASALNLTGQLEQARTLIERAVRMDRRNAVAHHNHGVILENQGLYAAASGAYDEAVTLEPALTPSVLALARLLARRGRASQAQAVLQRGLAAQPEAVVLLVELGALQLRAGQGKASIETLKRAVQLAPRHPAALTNLGFAYEQEAAWSQAWDAYSALAAAAPAGSPEACSAALRMGRVRVRQGRVEDARPLLQRAHACGGDFQLTLRSDPELRAALEET